MDVAAAGPSPLRPERQRLAGPAAGRAAGHGAPALRAGAELMRLNPLGAPRPLIGT